jgi:hypothetical protein
MKVRCLAIGLLAIGALAACRGSRAVPSRPEIGLVVPAGQPADAFIAVAGVPSRYLPTGRDVSDDLWPSILRVTVAGDDQASAGTDATLPAVAGAYSVNDDRIVFKPMFGFDPGRRYRAVFDGGRLPAGRGAWKPEPVVAIVGLPGKNVQPTTLVDQTYPTAAIVPENQLRLYLHFSAPMGRTGGLDYVRLLDAEGRQVPQPFLPLEAEFWNADRTRYTVFFDPGRVKRGILPNEQLGRPLKSGRRYTLVVDRGWPDGNGLPLKEEFRRTFRVGPADVRPLQLSSWRMSRPSAGSRDAFSVSFPEPLDQGLLMRALGVESDEGRMVPGEVATAAAETEWRFVPRSPWSAGGYRLVVLTILEDLAGNRIGRAFEADQFDQVDRQGEPERITLPFRIERPQD